MGEIRQRLRAAIATIEDFASGRFELRLRPPATEERLLEAEREFGMPFPEDLRELYLLHDGQDQLLSTAHLFLDEPFATLRRGVASWRSLRDFYDVEPGVPPIETGFPASAPELRAVEHDIAWFPFAVFQGEDKTAYWVDMNPIEGRPVGQVIEEGPWAHPPQFVADSVLDLLEAIAAGIERGDITTTPQFGFVRWGFGPRQVPVTSIARLDHSAESYPTYLDDLPPEWSAYLRTKSPLYCELVRWAVQGTAPGESGGAPITESALALVDMAARPPRAIPTLADLTRAHVVLERAESLEGLDRRPVTSIVLIDSPDVSFDGIELTPYFLEIVGEAPIPDAVQTEVHQLKTPVTHDTWAALNRYPALRHLSIQLDDDADPNDHDWFASTELTSLDVRGGTVSSLAFVSRLPRLTHLRLLAPHRLAVTGLPLGVSLSVNVVDAPVPADIGELERLELPASLSGPVEWYRALEGRLAPGVWTAVYARGDASEWADLSAMNWMARREALTDRGLSGS